MVRAEANILIRRPVESVFDFVVFRFFENYPRWSPEVVELKASTPPPVRVGTTGRQVRVDQGRRTESTFRVSALDEGQRVVFQGTSNPFMIMYRFHPLDDDSTRLTFSFELSRLDLFMRPFEKLIRLAIQEGAEQVVHSIKGLIEIEYKPTKTRDIK